MTEEGQVHREGQVGRDHQDVLVFQDRKATLVVLALEEILVDLGTQVSLLTTVLISVWHDTVL